MDYDSWTSWMTGVGRWGCLAFGRIDRIHFRIAPAEIRVHRNATRFGGFAGPMLAGRFLDDEMRSRCHPCPLERRSLQWRTWSTILGVEMRPQPTHLRVFGRKLPFQPVGLGSFSQGVDIDGSDPPATNSREGVP